MFGQTCQGKVWRAMHVMVIHVRVRHAIVMHVIAVHVSVFIVRVRHVMASGKAYKGKTHTCNTCI
jgi:hypothetical protein